MNFTRNAAIVLSAAALLTGLGGCVNQMWYPGGPMASRDAYTYESTAVMPQTVTLTDLRTEQVLYTWVVPVDQQLIIRFRAGEGNNNNTTPDRCEWDLIPRGKSSATPRYAFNVAPASARRIDSFLRNTPESPEDMRGVQTTGPGMQTPAPANQNPIGVDDFRQRPERDDW
jgi:hypothetical protein